MAAGRGPEADADPGAARPARVGREVHDLATVRAAGRVVEGAEEHGADGRDRPW